MSIKRKLILIGICIGIILVVFTVNVVKKMKEDGSSNLSDKTRMENYTTRAEAYRLLSYLRYNKAERETIPVGITYADSSMSGWYDTYVNAVWKMGLIDSNITVAPGEALTYGDCKAVIDQLIMAYP
jgi:stage II sporulation protein D